MVSAGVSQAYLWRPRPGEGQWHSAISWFCIDHTAAGDVWFQLALNLAQASKAHLANVYALREPRSLPTQPAGVGLPPTVLGPVSPEGARAMEGQPISAAAPVVDVLREAERVDTVEERFREELAAPYLVRSSGLSAGSDCP